MRWLSNRLSNRHFYRVATRTWEGPSQVISAQWLHGAVVGGSSNRFIADVSAIGAGLKLTF